MPDTIGTGEDIPNGKIVILEDSDKDGVMDRRTVFLDSLVLPRAICLIDEGILVAEPPRLWYYQIRNDRPVAKTLVDERYAVGGNVEHQPNGLLRALDNWIYNAKSGKRYRRSGDQWLIENTHFRGQWGISQDNYGRLYYNHNSANVIGDYFLPGFGSGNSHQKRVNGYNMGIVTNNRVYPARPTPGVNRGYMKGILDDSLRLANFTAACGPLVYRGDLFGPAYQSNVFVPEPSANLIKRNILTTTENYPVKGQQAYSGREFLASTDERFRPVSICNAPDGALYVVDMYRGIIQHKTYLTPYLKGEIVKRELTPPIDYGRIYKITPKGQPAAPLPALPDTDTGLVGLLGHPNGWIRDFAQQRLIDRKAKGVAPSLHRLVQNSSRELEIIHALWTLEGLGELSEKEVLPLLSHSSPALRIQGFGLIPSVITAGNYPLFVAEWHKRLQANDVLTFPYIAYNLHNIMQFNQETAWDLLQQLARLQPDNPYVADAVISNLYDRESRFQKELSALAGDTNSVIHKQLTAAINTAASSRSNRDPEALTRLYPKGAALYKTICQTCHGADGNGIESLAPPLNQSEWVTGDKDKLSAIVLFGLTGPITVNNRTYSTPEIAGEMPGIGYDPEMASSQIAELLTFIRKSWQNNAEPVHVEEVERVRTKLAKREKAFTVPELDGL